MPTFQTAAPVMLDLRDMEILIALSRHGHFQRAANACGISQPAFSTRIRKLEKKLGAPLVKRGNRYVGLTSEGEIAVQWARRILQNTEGMRQDIAATRDGLTGHISIGAVPTAVAFAAKASIELRRTHPGLTVEIRSGSSDQIARDLADFALDVGITYTGRLPAHGLHAQHLYDEAYVLVVPENLLDGAASDISWKQAAQVPLCLLSSDMNNRRIIDNVFAQIDVTPIIALETNAFTAALVQVSAGLAGTIAPQLLVENLPLPSNVVILPLTDPVLSEPICLATTPRSADLATVRETLSACRDAVR